MNILMAHNFYQQPGGEDQSFASESAMLEACGHRVLRFTRRNEDLAGRSLLQLAADTVWSRSSARELRGMLRDHAIDIAHFQNTFPMISPSAYYAARDEGVPVVQSLRNYRLVCPNALLYRSGRVCEDCLPKALPWPGVVHRCYRGSLGASAVTATMLTVHRALGTWSEQVDMYIASTEFSRQKFITGGLPEDRIAVKPNFVYPDPGQGLGEGKFALYAGRLTEEKGVRTLLAAWELVGDKLGLKIAGDGPMAADAEAAGHRMPGVEWLGPRPIAELYALMGAATALIFPSEWYETFGRTVIESFAKGTPVVAANLGGLTTMVDHGRTGLHYRAGDAGDLAAQIEHLLRNPALLSRMRREARAEFERHYTAERNYELLMRIYATARERQQRRKL
jgi:glycosyltransferase involved in cell wall biosynthesis